MFTPSQGMIKVWLISVRNIEHLRGMEEPLLYSEMMKLAIQRGYKYYGYDPETYWDKTVEEKEPTPVERGTPAPILTHQVEILGLPPKLPR